MGVIDHTGTLNNGHYTCSILDDAQALLTHTPGLHSDLHTDDQLPNLVWTVYDDLSVKITFKNLDNFSKKLAKICNNFLSYP